MSDVRELTPEEANDVYQFVLYGIVLGEPQPLREHPVKYNRRVHGTWHPARKELK